MKGATHIVLRGAARLHIPLIALLAISVLVSRPAGGGVGLIAGLVFALALMLHVLVFGAAVARRALPGLAARLLLSLGLIVVFIGAGAVRWVYAPQALELGLFLLSVGAASLVIAVLVGRAPTLRDEDW